MQPGKVSGMESPRRSSYRGGAVLVRLEIFEKPPRLRGQAG